LENGRASHKSGSNKKSCCLVKHGSTEKGHKQIFVQLVGFYWFECFGTLWNLWQLTVTFLGGEVNLAKSLRKLKNGQFVVAVSGSNSWIGVRKIAHKW